MTLDVSAAADPAPTPSRLEPAGSRRLGVAFAAGVVVAFLVVARAYWVPAHPGVDQNGYLVGGRVMAATGSTGFRPDDPFAFVGRMWVQVRSGRCFPKYPVGLSALYAVLLKLGGPARGVRLCFGVNPVAMTLGLAAAFAIVRRVSRSSFAALLALLIVATSPVCVGLTDNPNSHATAFCCVGWGMWLLLRWWQSGGLWRAIVAGLLLGTAVTIRYTEGLLLLPVVLVAALNRPRRTWPQGLAMAAAWAVPVGVLVAYNLHQMGTLTGYDPTNESTGFAWANFAVNWETMGRELAGTGLFFTLPFAVLGAVVAWRTDWRAALLLATWAVPNLLLYSAYYWAPDNDSISYLRFTLTVFPALAAAAVLGLRWVQTIEQPLATVAVGLVVAIGCGTGLWTSLDAAAAGRRREPGRASRGRRRPGGRPGRVGRVRARPAAELPAAGRRLPPVRHPAVQPHTFVQRLADVDPNAPTGLQPQRAHAVYVAHKDDTAADLLREEAALARDGLAAGRRVFMVEPADGRGRVLRRPPRRRPTVRRPRRRLLAGVGR